MNVLSNSKIYIGFRYIGNSNICTETTIYINI